MSDLKTKLPTDEWVIATWDEYEAIVADSAYEKAKGYYHNGQLRIEMAPQGYDHSYDNFMLGHAIALFGSINGIPMSAVTNCTFRKIGEVECQPDLAFYIADNAEIVPHDTSLVEVNLYPPPDLVIEVAKSSLADDLGSKRLLYEQLGVCEYWVVDVRKAQLVAFAIADGGSKRITKSLVLPGLALTLLEEGLRRSREFGRSQLYAWLLAQLQASSSRET